MPEITEREIRERPAFDNPWWKNGEEIDSVTADYPQRLYFQPFRSIVADSAVRRAVILLGQRRVGKTAMAYRTVQSLPGNLVDFPKKHSLVRGTITTGSVQEDVNIDGIAVRFVPSSLVAYTVSRNRLTQIAGETASFLFKPS